VVKKGDILVKPGKMVRSFYYLETGCIYYYKIEAGEVKVLEFYTEDAFFTDLYSYVQEVPSESFLVALEDTVVYAITKEDV